MGISNGIYISCDETKQSEARVSQKNFQLPEKVENLNMLGPWLCIAGGRNEKFNALDFEVWGLNWSLYELFIIIWLSGVFGFRV